MMSCRVLIRLLSFQRIGYLSNTMSIGGPIIRKLEPLIVKTLIRQVDKRTSELVKIKNL